MDDKYVIKSVWGTYWVESCDNWGTLQAATEYIKDELPLFLEWDGPDGTEELTRWDDAYYYDGDDSPTATPIVIQ